MGTGKVKDDEFLKLTMKKTLIILDKQGKGLLIIIIGVVGNNIRGW